MSNTAFSKDSQNPYRTGVLIGNHTEDRFGLTISSQPVNYCLQKNYQAPTTEQRAKYHLGNSMFAYEVQPKNLDVILAEKEQREYEEHMKDIQRGTKTHLFFGHGATQDDFVKRDFGTSNNLFYDKRMKTEALINPHYYHAEETKENPLIAKSQAAKFNDANPTSAQSFGQGAFEAATSLGQTKPKAYNDFTKKFDNNYQKMGLRR